METHFFQSKTFKGVVYGAGVATAVLLIFAGGMAVGTHRAFFACKWGENYGRNFGGPVVKIQARIPPPPFDKRVGGFHGALGSIIGTVDDGIVVKGRDDVERSVLITDDTEIHSGTAKLTKDDLSTGMQVMTFGDPSDEGRIQATFIRVLSNDLLP